VVARRLAAAGFIALAPDGLSSLGGYPGDDDKGRELQAKLESGKLTMDFVAAFEWLKKSSRKVFRPTTAVRLKLHAAGG
jgi:carboxymethylenebutenolidase